MQFVFLALLCIFAGYYAVKESVPEKRYEEREILKLPKRLRVLYSRLFFRSASGLMAILIVVGARTGSKRPYFVFIIAALCASLLSDVFSVLSTEKRKYLAACLSLLAAAGIFYLCAFYNRAALSWIDAALFALFAVPAAAVQYNMRHASPLRLPTVLFTAVLCAVSAKGASMLFLADKKYIYVVFAAVGALLFSISNFIYLLKDNTKKTVPGVYYIILYYCGQALLALSVMM